MNVGNLGPKRACPITRTLPKAMRLQGQVLHEGGIKVNFAAPQAVLGKNENELAEAKWKLIEHARLNSIAAKNIDSFAIDFHINSSAIFPEATNRIIFKKSGNEFKLLPGIGMDLKLTELGIGSLKLLINRAVGEAASTRKTIYFPVITQKNEDATIFTGDKFDRGGKGYYEEGVHMVNYFKLSESRFGLDTDGLRTLAPSIIVSPICDMNDGVEGAFVMFGEKDFINPYIDIPLSREYADILREPLSSLKNPSIFDRIFKQN